MQQKEMGTADGYSRSQMKNNLFIYRHVHTVQIFAVTWCKSRQNLLLLFVSYAVVIHILIAGYRCMLCMQFQWIIWGEV